MIHFICKKFILLFILSSPYAISARAFLFNPRFYGLYLWRSEINTTATLQNITLPDSGTNTTAANETIATAGAAAAVPLRSLRRKNSTSSSKSRPKIAVSFINGIYHSNEDWNRITENLTAEFGVPVHAMYNPSSGRWLYDATQAGYELLRSPADSATVSKLAMHLRGLLATLEPPGRVLHLAHSGGAIITYLAAKHRLTREETDRIDVATFGGARSITRKYFRGRTVNYYARNDPLLVLDRRANSLVKRATNGSFDEVYYQKYNTSFIFMLGVANNPILDHSMEGPTYLMALRREAIWRRRREYLLGVESALMHEVWFRSLRKTAANMTGMHHFWGKVAQKSKLATEAAASSLSFSSVDGFVRKIRKGAAKYSGYHGFFSGRKENRNKTELSIKTSTNAVGI